MPKHENELGWCTIAIDTDTGLIVMQQRWLYQWAVQTPAASWTPNEQKGFHTRAVRNIRAHWHQHVRLSVAGTAPFATRFRSTPLTISIDIRWVLSAPHWTVTVTKVPHNIFRQSYVEWTNRRISLDTNDFRVVQRCGPSAPLVCTRQVPVTHEFGHAAGNTMHVGHGDEYKPSSPYHADGESIMNSGNVLRARHFDAVVGALNTMLPGASFSVRSVR